jgi:ankyrin repeat protein
MARCANCNNEEGQKLRCSQCGQVSYCNSICQKAHWKIHKAACKNPMSSISAAVSSPPLPLQDKVDEKGRSALWGAAYSGNLARIDELYRSGSNITQADHYGMTPLAVAVARGHLDVVSYLCPFLKTMGANIHQPNTHGMTPIWLAADKGHLGIVIYLRKAGANIDQPDDNGMSPVWIAAQNGHLDVVIDLHQAGANIHQANHTGTTPLGMATQEGQRDVVIYLHEAGADIKHPNGLGKTPLWMAIQNGYRELVSYFCEKGAYPDQAKLCMEKYILLLAIKYDHLDIFKDLVSFLASKLSPIDYQNSLIDSLYFSAQNGYQTAVRLLIKETRVDVRQRDSNVNERPLWVASRNGHSTIVEMLLSDYGKGYREGDAADFQDALEIACLMGRREIASRLSKLIKKVPMGYENLAASTSVDSSFALRELPVAPESPVMSDTFGSPSLPPSPLASSCFASAASEEEAPLSFFSAKSSEEERAASVPPSFTLAPSARFVPPPLSAFLSLPSQREFPSVEKYQGQFKVFEGVMINYDVDGTIPAYLFEVGRKVRAFFAFSPAVRHYFANKELEKMQYFGVVGEHGQGFKNVERNEKESIYVQRANIKKICTENNASLGPYKIKFGRGRRGNTRVYCIQYLPQVGRVNSHNLSLYYFCFILDHDYKLLVKI